MPRVMVRLEGVAVPAAKPERLSWTPTEDDVIVASVDELGHKWYQIAARLPGRTEHAIRNRYHRVLTAMAYDQRQRQPAARVLAPSPPVIAAMRGEPVFPMALSAAMLVGA